MVEESQEENLTSQKKPITFEVGLDQDILFSFAQLLEGKYTLNY